MNETVRVKWKTDDPNQPDLVDDLVIKWDLKHLAEAAKRDAGDHWITMAQLAPTTFTDAEAAFVEACSPQAILDLLEKLKHDREIR